MKKPRVLFIVPLPPPVHGAALRNKSLIESKRIQDTFDLSVIPISFIKEMKEMGKFSIVKTLKTFTLITKTVYTIGRWKPDLIYFNMATFGFALYRDMLLSFIVLLLRKKLLIHIRTQKVKEQALKSGMKRFAWRWIFSRSEVICLSKNLAKDIEDVISKPIHIINNGIEMAPVNNQLHSKSKDFTFLFLSNFVYSKGVDDLLKAGKILSEKSKQYNITMIGSPVDYSVEELNLTLKKLRIDGHFTVCDPAFAEEKWRAIMHADALVLPTHFDAFPGVLLEAMQMAKPVISTYEGAIPEIVQNNVSGFLVEKNNPKMLAAAMEKLIENPRLAESLGSSAKEIFERKFTMEKFEEGIIKTFLYAIGN